MKAMKGAPSVTAVPIRLKLQYGLQGLKINLRYQPHHFYSIETVESWEIQINIEVYELV